MTDSLELKGSVAIVTGAARGQGRSHALAMARQGATIIAVDVPQKMASVDYALGTQADLDETVRLVEATGAVCIPEAADVRDAAAVNGVVERAIERFGRIDILLANAGISGMGPLEQVSDVEWEEMVGTNLTGVFHCLRAVIPTMREQRFGRIVVTSSMGGRMGIPNLAHYNATKWGVIGMAKSLALEVATVGITVNVVCPCTVATPMVLRDEMYKLFAPDLEDPDQKAVLDRFRRVNPIPEPWLQAEDVTRAVMYFVNDPGTTTGEVLEIGLGSSARLH